MTQQRGSLMLVSGMMMMMMMAMMSSTSVWLRGCVCVCARTAVFPLCAVCVCVCGGIPRVQTPPRARRADTYMFRKGSGHVTIRSVGECRCLTRTAVHGQPDRLHRRGAGRLCVDRNTQSTAQRRGREEERRRGREAVSSPPPAAVGVMSCFRCFLEALVWSTLM